MKTRILATRIAAAAALVCLTPSLHAANRFWINTTSGTFGTSGNWSATDGGASGATVPVADDTANFTLNNTATVNFSAATTNTKLIVDNGTNTFDLGGFTYMLKNNLAVDVGTVAGRVVTEILS